MVEIERGVLTEQRTNNKFLVKLGKSEREILEMLVTVYKWVNRFKEWQESVDDNAREGRPSAAHVGENIQRVHDLVMSDRRITTGIITDKLGISKSSVQTILKEDLNKQKLCAKIVPKVFTQEQKRHVACCQDWMENEEGSNFLQRIITGDKSWIYECDPETKRQSEEWKHSGSSRSKKACKSRSKIKIMLIVFFFIYLRNSPSQICSTGSNS
jgi:hypothetical protein